MGNSSGSMLYMVALLIIIYVVGMGIYQGVKFIQKSGKKQKIRNSAKKSKQWHTCYRNRGT